MVSGSVLSRISYRILDADFINKQGNKNLIKNIIVFLLYDFIRTNSKQVKFVTFLLVQMKLFNKKTIIFLMRFLFTFLIVFKSAPFGQKRCEQVYLLFYNFYLLSLPSSIRHGTGWKLYTYKRIPFEYYTDRDILNIKLVESEEVCVLPLTKYNLSLLLYCQRIWLSICERSGGYFATFWLFFLRKLKEFSCCEKK